MTFTVRGGRVFTVARDDDGGLRIRVEGAGDWQSMGRQHTPTIGAVVGSALRWWYETTGDRLFLAKPDQ